MNYTWKGNKNKTIVVAILIATLFIACKDETEEIQTEKEKVTVDVVNNEINETRIDEDNKDINYEEIYKEKIDISDKNFCIFYLDDDEIPEIALYGDGKAHNEQVTIYTINEDEPYEIGSYGQYGTVRYSERNGYIVEEYDSAGSFYTNIYKFDGCDAVIEVALKEDYDDEQIAYYLNGEIIDEDEYSDILNGYEEGLLSIGAYSE